MKKRRDSKYAGDKTYACIEDWDDERSSESEEEQEKNVTEISGDTFAPISLELCYKKFLMEDYKRDAHIEALISNLYQLDSSVTDYSLSSNEDLDPAIIESESNMKYMRCIIDIKKLLSPERCERMKKYFQESVVVFSLLSAGLCTVLLITANHYLKIGYLNNTLGIIYIVAAAYVVYSAMSIIIYRRASENMFDKIRVCRPLLESFVGIIIISYTYRVLCETYINDLAHFIVQLNAWKGITIIWIIFIICLAFIFSKKPEQISFTSVFQQFALMVLVIDRLLYNPFVGASAEKLYHILVYKPILLIEKHTAFFLDDRFVSPLLGRYVIQYIVLGFSGAFTAYFGLFLFLGVSRSDSLRIGSNIVVAVLQMIAIIFSPIIAIILSTAVISELNTAQVMSIMVALFISPSVSLNTYIISDFPKREILLINLVTIIAVQVMCGIAFPTGSSHNVQLILRHKEPTYLFDMPWKGMRSGIYFFPKGVTYLATSYIFLSLMIVATDGILSYIYSNMSTLVPTLMLRDFVALILYPPLKMTGISWKYIAEIARLMAVKILAPTEIVSHLYFALNVILMMDCVKASNNYTIVKGVQYFEISIQDEYGGTKLFSFFSNAVFDEQAAYISMFLVFNSISLRNMVLFYTSYFALMRSEASKIFYAMIYGTVIAFLTNLLIASLIGFYQPQKKKLVCDKAGVDEVVLCNLLLTYNMSDLSNGSLCKRIQGDLHFKYRLSDVSSK